jgi:phosphatidylglycerol:prolipoprotein diacylglycerol transferase
MTLGSLVTLVGYLVGAGVFYLAARAEKRDSSGTWNVLLVGLAAGILGAKATEWLVSGGPALAQNPTAFLDPNQGGRAVLGGILAGWVAILWARRRFGVVRPTGDLFALALPAGEAVGRFGCFFNGCCYGIPASRALPWAVFQHDAWRHPAQLYTAMGCGLVFGLMLGLRGGLPREGDLFRAFLIATGLMRFGIEFWRERELLAGGLSLAQWVCLALVAYGAYSLRKSFAPSVPQIGEAAATGIGGG